jgi:ABC-type Zn uptake system ZnuABC Zn-binding protein ZnuA
MVAFASLGLAACGAPRPSSGDQVNDKIKVVATTTILGDVVSNIGDEQIELMILLPSGTDPHGFEPTPQDIAAVSDAQVVFAVGGGLEEFLEDVIDGADASEKVEYVSEGIDLLAFEGDHDDHDDHGGAGKDPHTWTDPNHVISWVQHIEEKLSELDPEHAVYYQANANSYIKELEELHNWITTQTDLVPDERRVLVADHLTLGYFAHQYGFEQIGALIPAYSSMAEPSAQELADLEDAIQSYGVPAIFVGNTVNPDLAQRVSEDSGTQLIFIYTGSLSEPGGEAATYLEYMRYNTSAIVDALK